MRFAMRLALLSPSIALSMLFCGVEGWMLQPVFRQHKKWFYLFWVPYCMGLGVWSSIIEIKRQRKKFGRGYRSFRIRYEGKL